MNPDRMFYLSSPAVRRCRCRSSAYFRSYAPLDLYQGAPHELARDLQP